MSDILDPLAIVRTRPVLNRTLYISMLLVLIGVACGAIGAVMLYVDTWQPTSDEVRLKQICGEVARLEKQENQAMFNCKQISIPKPVESAIPHHAYVLFIGLICFFTGGLAMQAIFWWAIRNKKS